MSDNIGKLTYIIDVENEQAKNSLKDFQGETKTTEGAVKQTEKETTKSFDKINVKALAVAGAIGTAVAKLSKDVIKATNTIQAGRKNIVNATGATGANLESLMTSAKNVFATVDESFDEVSRAIGEINTRLGLTGTALEGTTRKFLDFAGATNQDVQQAVSDVTKAMNQWNLEAEELPLLLDKLTVAGQASGVSVASLSANLTDSAGTLRAMGYSMDEAIALMMTFEKQGIDSSAVLMGMKQSFAQSAKAGTDARKDWDRLLSSIENATDETEANSLAIDTFGTRVASTLVTALRDGKLNFDEFTEAIKNSEGALADTDKAGKTTGDRVAEIKNQMTVALSELGEAFVPLIESILPAVTKGIEGLANVLRFLFPPEIPFSDEMEEVATATDGATESLKEYQKVLSEQGHLLTKNFGSLEEFYTALDNGLKMTDEDIRRVVAGFAYLEKIEKETADSTTKAVETAEDRKKKAYAKKVDDIVKGAYEQADEEKKAISSVAKASDEAYKQIVSSYMLSEEEKKKLREKYAQEAEEAEKERARQTELVYQGLNTNIGSAFGAMFREISETGAVSIDTLKKTTASAFGTIGNALYDLGKDLAEGKDAWGNLGKAALRALAQIVRALAEEMTARAVLAAFSLNFGGALALGAGAAAAYIAAGAIDGWANSLAVGKDYVPYDGYPASLHKGEMVLTRPEAETFRDLGGLYGLEKALSPQMVTARGNILSSVNVNNNLHAVIEVDGTQLGVAVLKSIDDARPFVMG